ncbi:MAG: T9SS type A sorting domain-containing protein [Cyclobacteriaceae bacterium]|nr:T9SS type A sorting domain-containing protein [Cyclobacteriaceae bacterium]
MRYLKLFALVTTLVLTQSVSIAQIVSNGTGGGAWNVGTTWSGGVVPTAGQTVTILANDIVTFNANATCASLTINANGRLSFTANSTLTITGNLTMDGADTRLVGTNNNQIITVGGNFSVPASSNALWGGIRVTITGTTTVAGSFTLGDVNGIKTFNGTITVAVGGTWDNTAGVDPVVNCSIVNNGFWPAPTGGNGRYDVLVAGTYTYSGTSEIVMTRLAIASAATITNLGSLRLTRTANPPEALTVVAGGTFNNGNGVANALLTFTSIPTSASGAGVINFANTNNTVDYANAGAQTIFTTTYYNLTASNSGVKTLAGNTTVTNAVNISGSAILNATTFTLDGTANLVMSGTSELRLSKNSVALPELTGVTNTLASGTTITFNGSGTQTAKSSATYSYQNINLNSGTPGSSVDFTAVANVAGNLNFSGSGRMISNPVMTVGGTFNYASAVTTILSNNVTVGNFIFSNGTLNYSNRTITVNGNNGTWTFNGGGSFVNSASNVIFTTGTNQSIGGTASTSFANLTINNSNNVSLTSVDVSVQNNLNFISGKLITGATRNVYVPIGGTVTASGGTGWVRGNLQKDVSLGSPSLTFEVGGSTNYAPVDVVFNTVTTANILTVSTTDGVHPNIAGSNIEPNRSVNRYWTLTNTGIVFTNYSATFNYLDPDKDALFLPSSASVRRTNGIAWFTTTAGTLGSNATQFVTEPAANLPSGSPMSFSVGNAIITTGFLNSQTGTLNWSSQATWIQNRTGSIQFTNGSNLVQGLSGTTFFTTELAVGNVIMLQTDLGLTRRYTIQSITDAANLVLTTNAVATNSGGYGRELVPNAISHAVTIGNSLIPVDATTTITLDQNATVNSLDINTSTSARTTSQNLTHTGANALTVQTNVTVNQPGLAGTDAWNINAGSASVNGNVIIGTATGTNTQIARVNITTGSLSVNNVIFNTIAGAGNDAQAVLDMSGGVGGQVNLRGAFTFTNNRGRLTPGAGNNSTINLNGTSAQTLDFTLPANMGSNFNYSNLLFNNTNASGATITGASISATNATGNFRIQTGTVFTDNNINIVGNAARTFQIDPGATFQMNGNPSTFPTGYGTFNLGTTAPFGTVVYNQPTNNTIASQSFGNLTVQVNAAVFTLPATLTVAGNLVVGNGSSTPTLRGNNTTALTVIRNVTINASGIIDANVSGRIRNFSVGGDWTNNGTFTPSSNTGDAGVTFTGAGPTQPQIISGSSTDSFFRVVLNTAASTNLVQLNKNITISNLLTLTQGGIDLNGRILNITNTATTAIARTGGYVKSEKTTAPYGELRWSASNTAGSFVFPFGKSSTEFIPVTVNKTAGAPGGGTISIWTYATVPANTPLPTSVANLNGTSGGNSVADRFWGMTLSGYTTTRPIATLTFTAVGTNSFPPSEKPASIANIATVAASPAGIAAQAWSPSLYWDAATPSQTFANNAPSAGFFQVTAPGIDLVNGYVPWTLADISVPLPIQLTNFEANLLSDKVELKWRTESELNNSLFTVQRTGDGESFSDVTSVTGGGTTTTPKAYSTFDYEVLPGKWYYRLKQTDYDGKFTFSKLVAVDVPTALAWGVFPNPSIGSEFNVRVSANDIGKDVFIRLNDVSGKEVAFMKAESINSTRVKVMLPQPLQPGMYVVTIAVEQQLVKQKLVVR